MRSTIEPGSPASKRSRNFPMCWTNGEKSGVDLEFGQAFHDQQSDVMQAVQVMRQKAQAAGNLQSTPQIQVTQPAPQTIVIQPANPQVVVCAGLQSDGRLRHAVCGAVLDSAAGGLRGRGHFVGIGIGIGVGWGGGCWGCGHPWGWGGWA